MLVRTLLLFIIFLTNFSYADNEYNYESVLAISVVNLESNKSMVFAGPGFFLEFKSTINQAVKRFQPISTNISFDNPIYELELASRAGPHTLIIGNHWLSDGINITALTEVEFNKIQSLISQRNFDNDPTTKSGIMSDEALDAFERILPLNSKNTINDQETPPSPSSTNRKTISNQNNFREEIPSSSPKNSNEYPSEQPAPKSAKSLATKIEPDNRLPQKDGRIDTHKSAEKNPEPNKNITNNETIKVIIMVFFVILIFCIVKKIKQ